MARPFREIRLHRAKPPQEFMCALLYQEENYVVLSSISTRPYNLNSILIEQQKEFILHSFHDRFPELYSVLTFKGARIILVPSAFTYETGKCHWEPLLRARAIENQVYIIAPNQYGKDPLGNRLYGHSMIVDPWGTVIAKPAKGESIIYAELDLKYLNSVRKKLPTLKHKRNDIAYYKNEEG